MAVALTIATSTTDKPPIASINIMHFPGGCTCPASSFTPFLLFKNVIKGLKTGKHAYYF